MYIIIALALSILSLALLDTRFEKKYFITPYLFFFIGPVLTYFDVIGVLTGFDGNGVIGDYTFGITFYTIFIAYQISKNKEIIKKKSLNYIFSVLNPLYLFTGPIPKNPIINTNRFKLNKVLKIFNVIHSDLIIGLFFATILAPSLKPYLILKSSINIIDILLFGLLFEAFVYFNFAGYSMIAWAFMRILGIKSPRNFRHPFGANSIIDYWQRWHISLSIILKELFYSKIKNNFGKYGAVFIVFIASALWHGITFNFVLWGFFHAILWCLAYQLNKFNFKITNYFLFVFVIIIGRVIFAEIDFTSLIDKLLVIIDFGKWNCNSEYLFLTVSLREKFNLLLIILVLSWEIFAPRIGYTDRDYKYLKSPFISTLLAVYICLAFVGFNGEPIYGNR
jgi:alginate O-acetyltransferase complex protein AlgI